MVKSGWSCYNYYKLEVDANIIDPVEWGANGGQVCVQFDM